MLTDFGTLDDFAGVCHGVVAARAPHASVIHLTHGVTPQAVLQGALVLRNSLPYMPDTAVYMAVVDPGVGTDRRALAVEAADGHAFVGPDNGLLAPAIAACGGARRVVVLDNAAHQLAPVSRTFHGRDVFAPAAAHLAAGGDIGALGSVAPTDSLAGLAVPEPQIEQGSIEAEVWNVDRYGNIALLLDKVGLTTAFGENLELELVVGKDRFYALVSETFAHVRPGEILLYEDPYGWMSVAINQGDAAETFRMRRGKRMVILPRRSA